MTQQHLVAVLGRGVVDPSEPVVTADDLGFSRGDGCFDSLRVVTSDSGVAQAIGLDTHLDRLDTSAASLALTGPSRAEWHGLVDEALAAWLEPGEAVLKLVLTRGREWSPGAPTALVTLIHRGPQRTRGGEHTAYVDVVTLTNGRPALAFANAPWLLGGVKTLSYAVNVASAREARRRGADEVVFVSTDGYAMDAPTAGLIVLAAGVLRTTPVEATGILASVTVDSILAQAAEAGWASRIELIPVGDLGTADGVWLVSSGRGPVVVRTLDGQPLTVDQGAVETVSRLAGFG